MVVIETEKDSFTTSYRKASILESFQLLHPIVFNISIILMAVLCIVLGVLICK